MMTEATARDVLDATMTEAEWQDQVIKWAEARGWYVYHHYDSRQSKGKGFPDLVMVRGGALWFVELKPMKKYASAAQRNWLAALFHVERVNVGLWRPSDWPTVEEELR
jgi:hypothetical protein